MDCKCYSSVSVVSNIPGSLERAVTYHEAVVVIVSRVIDLNVYKVGIGRWWWRDIIDAVGSPVEGESGERAICRLFPGSRVDASDWSGIEIGGRVFNFGLCLR